jgi:outer membrane protein
MRTRTTSARWLVALGAALLATIPALASAETLTADQAIRRAAAQNPGLKAAMLDAAAARQSVLAEEHARDPVFLASVTGSYTEGARTNANGTSTIDSDKVLGTKAAVRYTTDIGTQLEIGTSGDVTWRGGQSASLSNQPTYTALAYLSARQPLLRGAGKDAQLSGIEQAESSATAAELQQKSTASQTALDVLSAYWELWYADRAVEVEEQALATAKKQLADAKTRQSELGTASNVDVLQFHSNVASINDSLRQAKTSRTARALELGRLLGTTPEASGGLEATGNLPGVVAVSPVSTLVDRANESSYELAAMRADLDASRSRVSATEDADQPRLDAFATFSVGALWADEGDSGLGISGGRPAFSVVGGLELELPLGPGRASADAARARTQHESAQTRYQERELAIASQVASLHTDVTTSSEQIALANENARIAGELADAERQRLILGTTTSSDVVKAEQTLREAELRKLRAQVDAAESQYQLEHATGALLDRFGNIFGRRPS